MGFAARQLRKVDCGERSGLWSVRHRMWSVRRGMRILRYTGHLRYPCLPLLQHPDRLLCISDTAEADVVGEGVGQAVASAGAAEQIEVVSE
jgi:hypothetical protein